MGDKQSGLATMEESFELIKACIESKGGAFSIREMPTLIGDSADADQKDPDTSSQSSHSSADADSHMGELDQAELDRLAAMNIEEDPDHNQVNDGDDDKGKDDNKEK